MRIFICSFYKMHMHIHIYVYVCCTPYWFLINFINESFPTIFCLYCDFNHKEPNTEKNTWHILYIYFVHIIPISIINSPLFTAVFIERNYFCWYNFPWLTIIKRVTKQREFWRRTWKYIENYGIHCAFWTDI